MRGGIVYQIFEVLTARSPNAPIPLHGRLCLLCCPYAESSRRVLSAVYVGERYITHLMRRGGAGFFFPLDCSDYPLLTCH